MSMNSVSHAFGLNETVRIRRKLAFQPCVSSASACAWIPAINVVAKRKRRMKLNPNGYLMYAAENAGYHFLRKGIIQDMTEKVSLLKWFHETSLTCGIQMCGTLTWCERGFDCFMR